MILKSLILTKSIVGKTVYRFSFKMDFERIKHHSALFDQTEKACDLLGLNVSKIMTGMSYMNVTVNVLTTNA